MAEVAVDKRTKAYRAKKEFDSRSVQAEQKPAIKMPALGEKVEIDTVIVPVDTPLDKSQIAALAFAEEPVRILIHRSGDRFSSGTTDLISINGIKAEIMFKNGWVPIGHLPKGVTFVTKRKYVEVLARAKQDAVSTTVLERDGEDPQNFVERVTTSVTSFSVIEDLNPKGAEWLTRLLASRA